MIHQVVAIISSLNYFKRKNRKDLAQDSNESEVKRDKER